MPKIYSIEGNIGSGKSTLIKFMKKNFKWLKHRKIIYLQIQFHFMYTDSQIPSASFLPLFLNEPLSMKLPITHLILIPCLDFDR